MGGVEGTPPQCAACASSRRAPFLEIQDGFGRPASLVRCRSCGLVQVAALPTPEELDAYYANYSYDDPAAWEVSSATAASLAALVRRLEPYRGQGRLLDVGCGAGAILRAFAGAGWSCQGTELSGVAADRLRAGGLVIHVGTLESLRAELGTYDVVVLSETIEHVRDPRGLLAGVPRLLRPGGALYLTTPHIDSLSRRVLGAAWRPIEVPEHLFYFNRRSMAASWAPSACGRSRSGRTGSIPSSSCAVSAPEKRAAARPPCSGRTRCAKRRCARAGCPWPRLRSTPACVSWGSATR